MDRARWQERAGAHGRVILYDHAGRGLVPWVTVKASRVTRGGNGLWAMRPFAEGEVIGVYMGKVVETRAEQQAYQEAVQREAARPDGDAHADEYIMQAGGKWVDGNGNGNAMRFANDARGTRWRNNARQRAGGEHGTQGTVTDDRWGIDTGSHKVQQCL